MHKIFIAATGILALAACTRHPIQAMNKEDNLHDQLAIRELIDRYTYTINHRKWYELERIFTHQATWKAIEPIHLEFAGLDTIKARIPHNVEKLEFLSQTSSEILITLHSNDSASVHSQLTETGRFSGGGNGMYAIGAYEDIVVKENGAWKFLNRTFVLRYIDTNFSFKGEIVR